MIELENVYGGNVFRESLITPTSPTGMVGSYSGSDILQTDGERRTAILLYKM